ncbi:MAG: sigma-54-dependent Fis family transcriptional regulator [Calditrichaeota bacterium]|nr:sigma-54-dependent Fis family transcriptional regulator [Calditrichota bacterium]MCB9473134.1 sigma-54-dependent Fis family transcriptional regulator [Candidatus Delongbacteria bacterium]
MSERILFADDDANFLEVMSFLLEEEGYPVRKAANGLEALECLQTDRFPLMITDLRMPGLDGQTLLAKARGLDPELLVIVITAFGDVPHAVAAMKAGAFDFLPKPCDREQFRLTVNRAMEHARLRRQVKALSQSGGSHGKTLIHVSDAMANLLARADRIAHSDAIVLIEGESGTGKELLARRIHEASPRAGGPFVAINCGALPHDLLESELFGHVKGAFTGAVQNRLGQFRQAEAGTLFLDEIAELPLDLQATLLRVLQERVLQPVGGDAPLPVDVRVLAASNHSLEEEVREGRFRQDLYYRLNVVPLRIPPLRERSEDIICLARHFLAVHSGGREWRIPREVASQLQAQPWPGNVRELENLCQRAALLSEEPVLNEEFISLPGPRAGDARITVAGVELPADGISLFELERAILLKALAMNQSNQSATARFLRIPRHILLHRMEKFGIGGRDQAP